jgi:hypothetical protein
VASAVALGGRQQRSLEKAFGKNQYLFGDKYLFSILPNQQRARSDFLLDFVRGQLWSCGKVHHAEVKEICNREMIKHIRVYFFFFLILFRVAHLPPTFARGCLLTPSFIGEGGIKSVVSQKKNVAKHPTDWRVKERPTSFIIPRRPHQPAPTTRRSTTTPPETRCR